MASKSKAKNRKKLDLNKIAKALGARIITDPKERDKFERKYGLPNPLVPSSKRKK